MLRPKFSILINLTLFLQVLEFPIKSLWLKLDITNSLKKPKLFKTSPTLNVFKCFPHFQLDSHTKTYFLQEHFDLIEKREKQEEVNYEILTSKTFRSNPDSTLWELFSFSSEIFRLGR